jgi:hypothetical protein
MNWFWLRRHRRIPSAGGLPYGSTGRLARAKAARRILCAGLGVVVAGAAAGCTGSPGSTGQGRAITAASPSPVSPAKPYTVTVQAPGRLQAATGLIASGTIDGQSWQVTAAAPGSGTPEPGGQIFTTSGPAFGGAATAWQLGELAVNSADPVSLSEGSGVVLTPGHVQVQYGAVQADVTQVAVRLGNGTVLMLHPVAVYGVRAVAFAVPVGAGIVDVTAYSRHGEIATAIPFNAPGGVAAFGLWLTPGQHGLTRASGRIGSGTANGRAWSVTAYLGPWGICYQVPATGTASASCVPASDLDRNSDTLHSATLSFTGPGLAVAAGHAPAPAAWVIVNQPDGTTTKVWPVTVGGQKLFAFQLPTGPACPGPGCPNPLTWTAYDSSGHVVRWPAGSPSLTHVSRVAEQT